MTATRNKWAEAFEEKYKAIAPTRAKPVRAWLEAEGVLKIDVDPSGYRFGDLANRLVKFNEILTAGFAAAFALTWLEEVRIRIEEGGQFVGRPASDNELQKWNKTFFTELKPLRLGMSFDISSIDEYNEALPPKLQIIPNGLLKRTDDLTAIKNCLVETHQDLLNIAVRLGSLSLRPPSAMEQIDADEIWQGKDPLVMRGWSVSLNELGSYLKTIGGDWQLVHPSSEVQTQKPYNAKSPHQIWKLPDYNINKLQYAWYDAYRGKGLPTSDGEFEANLNELYRAYMSCEFEVINEDPHRVRENKNGETSFLGNEISLKSAVEFLEKRGVEFFPEPKAKPKVSNETPDPSVNNLENEPAESTPQVVVITKQEQPERQILEWLKSNGHKPQELRASKPGVAGVKGDAYRGLVSVAPPKLTESVFKKAWQRLLDKKEIVWKLYNAHPI